MSDIEEIRKNVNEIITTMRKEKEEIEKNRERLFWFTLGLAAGLLFAVMIT